MEKQPRKSLTSIAFALLLGVVWWFAPSSPAYAADGDLDPSFGTGGTVITDFSGANDQAYSLAIQGDGKIVAAGYADVLNFGLARYNSDGSLDASFGSGGKVSTGFGNVGYAYSVAIQVDGKIVVAGGAQVAFVPGGWDFALARYNPDGSLDPSFGTGGKVTTDFAGSTDEVHSVAIQADGKIVAVGEGIVAGSRDFVLARYNPDGSLDASFGSGGKVTTDFAGSTDSGYSVALQADGKIVVAGRALVGQLFDFGLVRYNPDGSLDASFGTGGKVTTDFIGGDQAGSVAIQPDGKIVVAGDTGLQDFGLARYNSDGSLDASFGTGGKVTTDFAGDYDAAGLVALQTDGKIVVAGSTQTSYGTDFALARYKPDGSLDASFGSGGKVTTDFYGAYDGGSSVALQADGKIVVAGSTQTSYGADFALARYLVSPSIEYTFIGFLPPLENPPVLNMAKAGQTVPVKWQLTDENGSYLSDLSAVTGLWFEPSPACDATLQNTVTDASTSGSSGLRYDSTSNQYIFTWKTDKSMAGICYRFILELYGFDRHQADVKLK